MMLVPQAITFAILEFVYSPISSLRFTKINMKTSKNGSSEPLATCEKRMNLIKGSPKAENHQQDAGDRAVPERAPGRICLRREHLSTLD